MKLHTKLGKPIPSTEPTVVASNSSVSTTAGRPAVAGTKTVAGVVKPASSATVVGPKKVMATPKITFVGGTQLKTTGAKTEEVKTEAKPVVSQNSAEDEDGEHIIFSIMLAI